MSSSIVKVILIFLSAAICVQSNNDVLKKKLIDLSSSEEVVNFHEQNEFSGTTNVLTSKLEELLSLETNMLSSSDRDIKKTLRGPELTENKKGGGLLGSPAPTYSQAVFSGPPSEGPSAVPVSAPAAAPTAKVPSTTTSYPTYNRDQVESSPTISFVVTMSMDGLPPKVTIPMFLSIAEASCISEGVWFTQLDKTILKDGGDCVSDGTMPKLKMLTNVHVVDAQTIYTKSVIRTDLFSGNASSIAGRAIASLKAAVSSGAFAAAVATAAANNGVEGGLTITATVLSISTPTVSMTPTRAPTSKPGSSSKSKKAPMLGAIIGGAVGGFVFIVAIVAAIIYCSSKKDSQVGAA